jgi:hypothetical protein
MNWFYANCNDSNFIHFGENPVVPAIVIIKKLEYYLHKIIKGNNNVSIKFYKPIRLLETLEFEYILESNLYVTKKAESSKQNILTIYGVK